MRQGWPLEQVTDQPNPAGQGELLDCWTARGKKTVDRFQGVKEGQEWKVAEDDEPAVAGKNATGG